MFTNNVIAFIQYDSANVTESNATIDGQYLNTVDLNARTWTEVRRGKYIPDGSPQPITWNPAAISVIIQNEIMEQEATYLSIRAYLFDLYNVLGMAAPTHAQIRNTHEQLEAIQATIDYLKSYIP